ncbi:MAG: peptidase M3 [Flavobacteriaceae bacterium CG2_30_34_30]|nr:M3 family metallopeptidase [Flavobacteriia bacterium]OIP48980.1 MAG: peptidase M3 [Flavobacteriaceae bacterium CG2_30_34_30]PIQ18484.1 MAG: peptidase M3 [Flavobacteriaceae bacterium CG18_big_fil_WC_8_21_14_2_50_34_36]PIV49940.1 MAG: peptidase M3 [Flavobacteriaceae bacterium CG02_land_8_20_14_3_00_34_13]PIZ08399.1 MAG: peptidase M3 [Flavobacteriaceae bacterium CG_4_10_14_0_8_um_filter_34_31]PJC07669.1 MAG: peptidase M3 [Flavobacteriaceae bacterium CG_4_9_14_0_8_um_filter_34_30]
MKNYKTLTFSKNIIVISTLLLIVSCGNDENKKPISLAMTDNLLLAPWTGPYDGTPAFDKMDITLVKPAIEEGITHHLKEIDAITATAEAPTFKNTIEAMERAGEPLNRAFAYYGIWTSNRSSPEFREIQNELAPKIADYRSAISQNKPLFDRIKTVYENSLKNPLEADQQRLVKLTYKEFEMNGANLNEADKKRYAEINSELSTLYTNFSNNVLADEENYITYITKDQLKGLPESFVNAAAKTATDNGKDGKYAITNTRSSMDPFLTYSEERELRKKVWKTYYSRGDNNDQYDNNDLVAQILKLRHERVKLLGYANFAEWRLQDRMAKTPKNAIDLMEAVWPAALARVKEEVADMQTIAKAEGKNITIEPWDYRFYSEKVRKDKYDLNSDEVKQYLELNNLTDAIFYTAGRLFNFKFTPITDGSVPVFHEDVKVWEVNDITTGEHIGVYYLDPFARQGKRSGAWATQYRSHSSFDGKKTVLASNNSNFVKAAPGESVLISWDDAETFFHEFGHALHFLSSEVRYPTLNGGVRDYTEFQSQLLERWLYTDEVINQFLKHHKTGEVIPSALVEKIKKASTFNQGFATTEFLASALMDMKYHTTDPTNINPKAFEKETLAKLNMPKEIVMRHRTPHFGHVFSSEGYATAYYGYLWADVLTSDAAEAFQEAPGGFYDKDLSAKLVKYLFAPRNAIDPAEAYRLFRGRDATIDALMRDRGFPVPTK